MWLAERWLIPVAWVGLLAAALLASATERRTAALALAVASLVIAALDIALWAYAETREQGLNVPAGHQLPVPVWGPLAVGTGLLAIAAGIAVDGGGGLAVAALGVLSVLVGVVDTLFAVGEDRQPLAPSPRAKERAAVPGQRRRRTSIQQPAFVPRHRVRRARAIRRVATGTDEGPSGWLLDVGAGRTRVVVTGDGRFADLVVGGRSDPGEALAVAALADMRIR